MFRFIFTQGSNEQTQQFVQCLYLNNRITSNMIMARCLTTLLSMKLDQILLTRSEVHRRVYIKHFRKCNSVIMYTVYIIELNRKIFPGQIDDAHLFRRDDYVFFACDLSTNLPFQYIENRSSVWYRRFDNTPINQDSFYIFTVR